MWISDNMAVGGETLRKLPTFCGSDYFAMAWYMTDDWGCDGICVYNPKQYRDVFHYWFVSGTNKALLQLYKEIIDAGHKDWLEKYIMEAFRDECFCGSQLLKIVFRWEMLDNVEV